MLETITKMLIYSAYFAFTYVNASSERSLLSTNPASLIQTRSLEPQFLTREEIISSYKHPPNVQKL